MQRMLMSGKVVKRLSSGGCVDFCLFDGYLMER